MDEKVRLLWDCFVLLCLSSYFVLFVVKLNPFSNDQIPIKDKITLDFTRNYTLTHKVVSFRNV